jgi:hypothetical protein
MPRWTIARLARALYGRDAKQARKAYVRRMIARADGTARRPLTKAQLRKIADQAEADRAQASKSAFDGTITTS